MGLLHLEQALIDGAIVGDVAVTVAHGVITAVTPQSARDPAAERIEGLTLPGLPNLHSHAFQRGMAGLSERRGASDDSFWTWREVMYRFLDRLTPQDVAAVAGQAYAEMLEAGFTSVCEFHYLHHDIDGQPYADIAAMAGAIAAAAAETGIGLTLLPVLYRFGGFGAEKPTPGQRRFLNDPDRFQKLWQASRRAVAGLDGAVIGVAPHSLRAVDEAGLRLAAGLAPDAPIHIHVAEQEKEVADCVAWCSQRPVERLFSLVPVEARWCLIHATHLTPAERNAIAASGAVAGLCPITEANLGDGIFDGVAYVAAGGRYGVGTDSNIQISAAGELTQLEYSQRLRDRRRARLALPEASVGVALYAAACAGGAQASGRPIGAMAPGRRADLVTLDLNHPALVGRSGLSLIDSAVIASAQLPISEVRIAGRRVVSEGRHAHRDAIRRRFATVMRRLLG